MIVTGQMSHQKKCEFAHRNNMDGTGKKIKK